MARPPRELLLRPATPGDGPELRRLYQKAFSAYSEQERGPRPHDELIVAEVGSALVGLARSADVSADMGRLLGIARSPWNPRSKVQALAPAALVPEVDPFDRVLTALAVEPQHRCRGIGTALALARIEVAQVRGARSVFVHCVRGSGSQSLYERLGFRHLLLVDRWYRNGAAMVLMSLRVG